VKIEPPSFNSKVAVDAQRGNTAATAAILNVAILQNLPIYRCRCIDSFISVCLYYRKI